MLKTIIPSTQGLSKTTLRMNDIRRQNITVNPGFPQPTLPPLRTRSRRSPCRRLQLATQQPNPRPSASSPVYLIALWFPAPARVPGGAIQQAPVYQRRYLINGVLQPDHSG